MYESGVKVARSYTLELRHVAIIASHAKDNSMNNSEALRNMLDQWSDNRHAREVIFTIKSEKEKTE